VPLETLGMMAKFWTPGRVKTRLAADIGYCAAAQIHELFVRQLARRLAAVADRRYVVVAPDWSVDDFRAVIPEAWQIRVQAGGDLGNRMQVWFEQSLSPSGAVSAGTAPDGSPDPDELDRARSLKPAGTAQNRPGLAVLIGADCPLLAPREIGQAFQSLTDHDTVLGPAADGGYYLIGLRGPWRQEYATLFSDIPWSSPEVLSVTRRRIRRARLSCSMLAVREDVDTVNELNRLRDRLHDRKTRESSDDLFRAALQQILE
jgi:glycosyltransferase A (GT-A) superfamily protein (DUF2064 family)